MADTSKESNATPPRTILNTCRSNRSSIHVLTGVPLPLPAQLPSGWPIPLGAGTGLNSMQHNALIMLCACQGRLQGYTVFQIFMCPCSHTPLCHCGSRTPFPYLGCVFVTLVALYQDVQCGDTVELQHTATALASGASWLILRYTWHPAALGMQVSPTTHAPDNSDQLLGASAVSMGALQPGSMGACCLPYWLCCHRRKIIIMHCCHCGLTGSPGC